MPLLSSLHSAPLACQALALCSAALAQLLEVIGGDLLAVRGEAQWW